MAEVFTQRVRALLDAPNLAHVATLGRDGAPHVQPVWISAEDDVLCVNTIDTRAWPKRVRRDARVAVSIVNAENQAEYVEIRGQVIDETHDGADAHIDALSRTYIGIDYPNRFEGERRLIFRIRPEHVNYINLVERIPGVPSAHEPHPHDEQPAAQTRSEG